jgi:hypothetical protein
MTRRILATAAVVIMTVIGSWSQLPDDAYHTAPPPKNAKLPPVLGQSQLWFAQSASQKRAYAAAEANSKVLYQLPCKCHCTRIGHTSLRSCFESEHGSNCDVCMKEAMYAADQTAKGKTPAQIRDGINKSEYQKIDLETGKMQ